MHSHQTDGVTKAADEAYAKGNFDTAYTLYSDAILSTSNDLSKLSLPLLLKRAKTALKLLDQGKKGFCLTLKSDCENIINNQPTVTEAYLYLALAYLYDGKDIETACLHFLHAFNLEEKPTPQKLLRMVSAVVKNPPMLWLARKLIAREWVVSEAVKKKLNENIISIIDSYTRDFANDLMNVENFQRALAGSAGIDRLALIDSYLDKITFNFTDDVLYFCIMLLQRKVINQKQFLDVYHKFEKDILQKSFTLNCIAIFYEGNTHLAYLMLLDLMLTRKRFDPSHVFYNMITSPTFYGTLPESKEDRAKLKRNLQDYLIRGDWPLPDVATQVNVFLQGLCPDTFLGSIAHLDDTFAGFMSRPASYERGLLKELAIGLETIIPKHPNVLISDYTKDALRKAKLQGKLDAYPVLKRFISTLTSDNQPEVVISRESATFVTIADYLPVMTHASICIWRMEQNNFYNLSYCAQQFKEAIELEPHNKGIFLNRLFRDYKASCALFIRLFRENLIEQDELVRHFKASDGFMEFLKNFLIGEYGLARKEFYKLIVNKDTRHLLQSYKSELLPILTNPALGKFNHRDTEDPDLPNLVQKLVFLALINNDWDADLDTKMSLLFQGLCPQTFIGSIIYFNTVSYNIFDPDRISTIIQKIETHLQSGIYFRLDKDTKTALNTYAIDPALLGYAPELKKYLAQLRNEKLEPDNVWANPVTLKNGTYPTDDL